MNILIVGAGETGVAAAGALRECGHEGRILLVSKERHHPYARPPLSKAMLTSEAHPPELIRDAGWLRERNIELRLGTEVAAVDVAAREAILADCYGRETVTWDRLLLATGARPRRLPMLDLLGGLAVYLRTHDDSMVLRSRLGHARSLVILGGGVIGLEVASSARSLGCNVVVIEPGERLMARAVAPGTSATLLDLHRSNSVDVRLGTGLISAELRDGRALLQLSDGGEVAADTVVAAIGVEPEDELARAIGCTVDNGILVDGWCETSVPDVFAAGDVTRFIHPLYDACLRVETWQHARKHGAHAARAMMGNVASYAEVPWFWSDQHGVNIQVAGLPEQADVHVNRGLTTLHMRGDRVVAATTIDNPREMRPSINLIAGGWRGTAATLLDESRSLAGLAQAHKAAFAV